MFRLDDKADIMTWVSIKRCRPMLPPCGGKGGFCLDKPNGSAVPTKNQTMKVDLPCEAEDRRKIRWKIRLDLISFSNQILSCLFYAINTFFLTLCGFIHFRQRLLVLIVTILLVVLKISERVVKKNLQIKSYSHFSLLL